MGWQLEEAEGSREAFSLWEYLLLFKDVMKRLHERKE